MAQASSSGEGAVIIATRDHRDAIVRRLGDKHALISLDAQETLDKFLVDGRPDAARFKATIQPVLLAAAAMGNGRVRAYGEMVAVLQAAGNGRAAIELERLWNRLEGRPRLRLLCGYPLSAFPLEADGLALASVLNEHSEAHAAESCPPNGDDDAVRRHVIQLQQRVQRLESVVSKHRDTERELAARILELDDIVVNAFEGMHRVGPDGTILWANPAELQMLGYSATEYIGRDIRDFHEDPAAVERILAKLKAGERVDQEPARMRAKDGSTRHVLIRSGGHFEQGVFVHSHCFTRDVTELVTGRTSGRADRATEPIVSLAPTDVGLRAMKEPLAAIATAAALLRADPAQAWRQHWINTIHEQVQILMRTMDAKRATESRVPPPAP